MSTRPVLTYVFDAYCGWCYAFRPALGALIAHVGDRADLRVVNGGLFVDTDIRPIRELTHIPGAMVRIREVTGVVFGPGFLDVLRAGWHRCDSLAAARGVLALHRAGPDRVATATDAVLTAFFRDGRDLNAPDTFGELARDLGLDADAVVGYATSTVSTDAARRDFARAATLRVGGYPTLLLTVDGTTSHIGDAASTPEQLVRRFDTTVGG